MSSRGILTVAKNEFRERGYTKFSKFLDRGGGEVARQFLRRKLIERSTTCPTACSRHA